MTTFSAGFAAARNRASVGAVAKALGNYVSLNAATIAGAKAGRGVWGNRDAEVEVGEDHGLEVGSA